MGFIKTEKSDNSEVEVAKPEEKDEVMEIKSASSKVEFSDQKSQDIPSEMSLSMSGSFAKSETSVTSPTKSSSTEGAVSPSIEDKSKASETVSVAISIDPCTLAQGYEDLKGKAGAKSITSPDTPQQNAPIADENLNTSQQDTAKDKQSEDPDTKPAQTDSDPCQSGPESETTTQGTESKVQDESNMVTSQTDEKDSKIVQEQEKGEQIEDKLEAMKDATEEYKDNLKGNGDKTSDSKVSLESGPQATTSDNKDSAQESTSAAPETSSATPVSVSAAKEPASATPESASAAPELASATQEPASATQEPASAESKADEEVAKWGKPLGLPHPKKPAGASSAAPKSVSAAPESASATQASATAESKADEEVAKWGKPLPIPSPVNPNGGLGSSRSLNNDTNNKQKTARKAEKKITPVYMDLAYVPHHGDANYTDIEFFKRVRARYYVFSGVEPSRAVFDALLEAKKLWENKDLGKLPFNFQKRLIHKKNLLNKWYLLAIMQMKKQKSLSFMSQLSIQLRFRHFKYLKKTVRTSSL